MRDALLQLGLLDEEINIYLCLLENKPLRVTQIARNLNLARTTVYRFITSLHEKGLVSEFIEHDAKTYTPLPPEQLPQLLQTKLEQIQAIIPELKNIAKKREPTSVNIYRGKSGVKTVMNDILFTNKPYTTLGAIEKYFEDLELVTSIWMKKATKQHLKGRLLDTKKVRITKYEQMRILPKGFISEITTVTYGKKTALFIWKKPFYIVTIEDETVTESNRNLFDELWKLGT